MSLSDTVLKNAKARLAEASYAYHMTRTENPQNMAKLASLWSDMAYWEEEITGLERYNELRDEFGVKNG